MAFFSRYSHMDLYCSTSNLQGSNLQHQQADTQRRLILEILCNVTTFGRSLIACSSKTVALTRILFAPHIGESLPNEGICIDLYHHKTLNSYSGLETSQMRIIYSLKK